MKRLATIAFVAVLVLPLAFVAGGYATLQEAFAVGSLLAPFALGAFVNKKDTTKIYENGGNEIAVFLTNAQAVAVYGAGSAGGWIAPSEQQSSNWGPDRDTEELQNEAAGVVITRVNRNEFTVTTTFLQTDDGTVALIRLLENTAVPFRMPLPTKSGTTRQWYFGRVVRIRKENRRTEAGANAARTVQVTFAFQPDPLNVARNGDPEIGPITLPIDQTDAAWSAYNDFKDTRVVS